MKVRQCELCNADAAVFCPSDAAFLCSGCDLKVHAANFLVARHVRQSVCSNCMNLTGQEISGVVFLPSSASCTSCPPDDSLSSSSGSSVCISSTTSPAKERSGGQGLSSSGKLRRPAEDIFVRWCGKLGVEVDLAVGRACKALKVCSERWRALPFRVCLAASMWLGFRLSREKAAVTWKVLKRLEEMSGVPAKIILAAESRLERAFKGDEGLHLELEEGWAETES